MHCVMRTSTKRGHLTLSEPAVLAALTWQCCPTACSPAGTPCSHQQYRVHPPQDSTLCPWHTPPRSQQTAATYRASASTWEGHAAATVRGMQQRQRKASAHVIKSMLYHTFSHCKTELKKVTNISHQAVTTEADGEAVCAEAKIVHNRPCPPPPVCC